jgi:hypothetical protein
MQENQVGAAHKVFLVLTFFRRGRDLQPVAIRNWIGRSGGEEPRIRRGPQA